MVQEKYFAHEQQRSIDLELDGCALEEWTNRYGSALFAKHPRGFRIFLPPERIAASDEYSIEDPYTVERNIASAFHQRRISLTLELMSEVVSEAPEVHRVLDLGCGQGHITYELSCKFESVEFTGIDYSVSAIEYAHEHFPNIDFAVGDAYNCPYSEGYFDVVVLNNLWEHVPDPLRLLSKVTHALNRDGYIILSTPSRFRTSNLVRVIQGKPVGFMSRHHVTEYTVGQVLEQMHYGGFDVKKILSRHLPTESKLEKLARIAIESVVSAVGSHHHLDSTVFYLGKRTTNRTSK